MNDNWNPFPLANARLAVAQYKRWITDAESGATLADRLVSPYCLSWWKKLLARSEEEVKQLESEQLDK